MKILHYTLGFTPERSGGLVNYATDLMEEQNRRGHIVCALYPGTLNVLNRKTYIKKDESRGINSFQIINSLPLPIFGGIKTPKDFMVSISKDIYVDFLKKNLPDVIHIHTLMGIHREFFEVAKKMKIPIIFTSHDYFGLAPEPNFYSKGESYDQTNKVADWIQASSKAMSTKKLRVFQLKIYPFLRAAKKVVNRKSRINHISVSEEKIVDDPNKIDEYRELRKYYQDIFLLVDKFHFNSSIAKNIFISQIDKQLNYAVISITSSRIVKRKSHFQKKAESKINVAYIGPDRDYKGFYDFICLADQMSSVENLEFHTYGYIPTSKLSNVFQHGKYESGELENVYKNIDILIVPSKWKETFGLIVLEAISFGKSVLVSSNVGASEFICDECIFNNLEELQQKLKNQSDFHLYKEIDIKTMKDHENEIFKLYIEARC